MRQVKLQYFLTFLVFSLLLIFLDSRGVLNPLRAGAQFVVLPLGSVTYLVKSGFVDTFSFLTFWRSGEARIKNLEQRNLELTARSNSHQQLERENRELKKQLGVTFLSDFKRVPATVLGTGRYLTINRGRGDGVRLGQTVVYLDNLVGQIVRVDQHASFVRVPTDVDSKVPVKVGAVGSVRGVAVGQFNSAILLDQVAQNEEIKIGDIILTSGDEGESVPDLIVGRVSRISSAQTDLFKMAEVRPLIKYDRLATVFVLIP